MPTFRLDESQSRARLARMSLLIIAGVLVLELFLIGYEISLLRGLQREGIPDDTTAIDTSDLLRRMVAIAQMGLILVSAVAFVRWMLRAFDNLETTRHKSVYTRYAVGWAFFIPIMNLWRPFQVVRDIYERAGKAAMGTFPETGLIGGWWTAWILAGITSQISLRTNLANETIEGFLTSDYWELASGVLLILAALAGSKIIDQYAQWEVAIEMDRSIADIEGEHRDEAET